MYGKNSKLSDELEKSMLQQLAIQKTAGVKFDFKKFSQMLEHLNNAAEIFEKCGAIDEAKITTSFIDCYGEINNVFASGEDFQEGLLKTAAKAKKKKSKKSKKKKSKKKKSVPTNKSLYAKVRAGAKRKFKKWPSAYASGWLVRTYKQRGGKYKTV